MSTKQNPQMTEVLVNISRNRIATDNDLAKYDMIQVLFELQRNSALSEKNAEYQRHLAKHIDAIVDKLGAPVLKKAYVPTQKFIIAE